MFTCVLCLGISVGFSRMGLRANSRRSAVCRAQAMQSQNAALPLRISGRWYDVHDWADRHPGGAWVLDFARGRDVTALFYAIHWHTGSRAQSILERFPQLDEAEALAAGAVPFTFAQEGAPKPLQPSGEKSEFAKELHAFLSEEFPTPESTKATPFHWMLVSLALLGTGICWWLWFQGDVLATAVLPLAHWFLVALTFHEACHSTLSTIPAINYVFQFTAHPIYENVFIWFTQHLVSHHQYTNDHNYDSDVNIMGTTRLSSATPEHEDPRPTFGQYGFTQFMIKGCLSTIGGCFMGPLWAYEDRPHPPFSYCIQPAPPRLSKFELGLSVVPSVFVLVWPIISFAADPLRALFLSAWPFVGSSVIWFVMAFTSHVQEECQLTPAPGRQERLADTCWWAQQAEASLDYSVGSAFWTHATAGLNAQSLHHLVPNVCHCHFPRIYERYAKICARHGVRLNQRPNLMSAVDGLFSFAQQLNPSHAVLAVGSRTEAAGRA